MNLQCLQIIDSGEFIKKINGRRFRIFEEDKGDIKNFVKVFQSVQIFFNNFLESAFSFILFIKFSCYFVTYIIINQSKKG